MTTSRPASDTQAIGTFRPARCGTVPSPGPDPTVVAALLEVSGLAAAVSDVLDTLGYRLTVPASRITPLHDGRPAVGRAITLRYLPTRGPADAADEVGRLAHRTLFDIAAPGDVAVLGVAAGIISSLLGGRAVAAARDAGLAGIIVDGAVRDVDEIVAQGLPVWAAARTAETGRGRVEAIEINGPLAVGGVQVVPGDIVVADASGIAFVPTAVFDEVARKVLAVT
jgi:regulator of RNase E activity RraA